MDKWKEILQLQPYQLRLAEHIFGKGRVRVTLRQGQRAAVRQWMQEYYARQEAESGTTRSEHSQDKGPRRKGVEGRRVR